MSRTSATKVIELISLIERRDLFWHGTCSVLARRIMKSGFVPKPTKKVYGADRGSIESFPGTYFTQNFMTAYSTSHEAVRRFGGVPVIFEVVVETRTATYDEDVLPDMSMIIGNGFQEVYGRLMTDRTVKYAFEESDEGASQFDKLLDICADKWISRFKNNQANIIIGDRPGGLSIQDESKIRELLKKWAFALLQLFDERSWGSSDESAEVRKIRNSLYKSLTGSPSRNLGDPFLRSLRVVDPVGFKGSNRIVGAVEFPNDMTRWDNREPKSPIPTLIVSTVYGTSPSETMLQAIRVSVTDDIKLEKGRLI